MLPIPHSDDKNIWNDAFCNKRFAVISELANNYSPIFFNDVCYGYKVKTVVRYFAKYYVFIDEGF